MKTTVIKSNTYSKDMSLVLKFITILTSSILLFLILISTVGFAYGMYYQGRIFPGVSVAGIDLSNLTPVEAAVQLAQKISYPQTGRIIFQDDSSVWEAQPSDLGLSSNLEETVSQAYAYGRSGFPLRRVIEQLSSWHSGRDLPPVLNYDEYAARAFLAGIAAKVDQPVIEASLELNGIEVITRSGQIGRQLDLQSSMAPLELHLRSMTDGLVPLVIRETQPVVLDVDQAAEQARRILSAPLALSVPDAQPGDPGPWRIEPTQLAEMLIIQRIDSSTGSYYEVLLNLDKLRPLLAEATPGLARQPANGRFVFNDETRQLELLQPSIIGRSLNSDATLQLIQSELPLGNHNLNLVIDYTQPSVPSDATAESLGIRELVSQHTSYFFGSSAARIQNIQTASERFHGVLVPPGATFSMAEVLGDVSLDNGYEEALIILGDRTIKGVGGGVCQVSTTLFRTVFLGGYPIIERHPHAYRVGYYEQTSSGHLNPELAGLDATVFVPIVDFKFVNDTPNWLLMETYFSGRGRKLTWKFYSTSDGRNVEWNTSGLLNIVEPPEPKYIEDPGLAKGQVEQVDWSVAGGDVSIRRTVYRNGEIYISDEFITHYQPWQAVFEYGPGTKIP